MWLASPVRPCSTVPVPTLKTFRCLRWFASTHPFELGKRSFRCSRSAALGRARHTVAGQVDVFCMRRFQNLEVEVLID